MNRGFIHAQKFAIVPTLHQAYFRVRVRLPASLQGLVTARNKGTFFTKRMNSTSSKPSSLEAPEGHKIITEGKASIIFGEKNEVFYNPVQVLNRDLSVLMISLFAERRAKERYQKAKKKHFNYKLRLEKDSNTFAPKYPNTLYPALLDEEEESIDWPSYLEKTAEEDGLSIFEALSASGLRSIRYFQEIKGIKSILVNDIDEAAVESIRRNIEFNQLDLSRVTPNHGDATAVMYANRNPTNNFDVVDLDPYGSAAIFMDGAVQSVADGGLLCVTCTDMRILGGGNPETCFNKYGCVPTKAKYLHEMALRIVLASLERHANLYQKHVIPIMSASIDFYVRLFVKVVKSPALALQSMERLSHVIQCSNCDSFQLHKISEPCVTFGNRCEECGGRLKMTGPIWSAPIHDMEIVKEAASRVESATTETFATKDRLHGLLTSISEEVENAPLYYNQASICSTLKCSIPPMQTIQSALINAGYKVSQVHKVPEAIKTNAPNKVVWDIFRTWIKDHPVAEKHLADPSSIVSKILSKDITTEVSFEVPPDLPEKLKAQRYPPNPETNWGPKARAKGKGGNDIDPETEKEREARRAEKREKKKQTKEQSREKKICKAFTETGNCRFGSNCKYIHEDGMDAEEESNA